MVRGLAAVLSRRRNALSSERLTIAYLFTTFPKSTETFLQREIVAMQRAGVDLRIYSLWGGGPEFEGTTVHVFNKWRLFELSGSSLGWR